MVQCSEVYRATIDGRVTESARKQFNYIQGHSERCNYAVYVKLALQANTDIARETFSKLGLQSSSENVSPSLSDVVPPSSPALVSMAIDERLLNSDVVDIARDTFSRLGSETSYEINVSEHNPVNSVPVTSSEQNVISPLPNAICANQMASRPKREGLNLSEFVPWPFDYLTYYDDWGTMHSCANKVAARIPWDEREKQCLRDIFNRKSQEFDLSVDKFKQLLQAVIDDSNARPLFHRNHVSDYARLREGLREKRVRRTSA